MYLGKTLFAQLMDFLPWKTFHRIVDRCNGDHYVKSLTCAGAVSRDGLRATDLPGKSAGHRGLPIGAIVEALPHGIPPGDQTLDIGRRQRNAELAYPCGIRPAPDRAGQKTLRGRELESTAYALDSTTIDLCLSLFPWALFRTTKSAVKMHTLLDLRGNIPTFIHISDGKLGDVKILDVLVLEVGAIYLMDRGYLDFARLYRMHQALAFFVTRAKSNTKLRRSYSAPVDRSTGVICDQTVALTGITSRKDYPEHLRRIRFKDPETGKTLIFLTNNFALPATTICALYKSRWQVELFFKWIKQQLRIKKFYGTSENAVKSQIWIAVSVYVLVAIVKKRLNLDASLYTLLQIFSLTLFEKMPIQQAFAGSDYIPDQPTTSNQLNLFAF